MIWLVILGCRNKDYSVLDSAPLEADPVDLDGDGFFEDEDCDDQDPAVYPGAVEFCDGLDNDCDELIDEDDAADAGTWYGDADADGYGDDAAASTSCEQPSDTSDEGGDCDDDDPAIHPGATEDDCTDPVDYNCDGSVGYADEDGDGWAACEDCDDSDGALNPDATEVCDDLDNDCDGAVDDEDTDLDTSTGSAWYADADGDGFGDAATSTEACEQPSGYLEDSSDCDDTDAEVNPDATEVCNGLDDDCDGTIDEDDAADAGTWYADTDGDGFGNADVSTVACDQPSGTVDDDSDCDDTDAEVNPDAVEVCDGIDNDCDGDIDPDDSADATTWYDDDDGDSYGDASASTTACDQPSGTVEDDSDCDDTDAEVNPDAVEVCDGIDNDCDGDTDPDDAWWDTDWDYRVPLTLTASSYDVEGPPVLVSIDFEDHLATLGDSGSFDSASLRVVLQDCSLDLPELPSQFLDEVNGLDEAADHSDSAGDGHGTVAFVYDEDGDLTSLETLSASTNVDIAVYFGTSGTAPTYSTSLTASTTGLSNSLSTTAFSAAEGGLVDSLTYSSTVVTSQTDSCCGNGIYSGGTWSNTPMYTTGTNAVDHSGDVLAVVSATGSLTSYDYTYWYWMFAGRPEVWVKTVHEATGSLSMNHTSSWDLGVRPWESRQDDISSGATFTSDTSGLYADITDSSGAIGVSFGYAIEPANGIALSNYDPYIISIGNDYSSSTGSSLTAASGDVIIDHPVMVVMPHDSDFADSQDDFFGLLEGVEVSEGTPETP